MVIVDTDVIIKCLQQKKTYLTEVTSLLEMSSAVITPVQISEVYSHALAEELPMIGAFFDLFKVEKFDRKVAELAGEFMQQYKPFYPSLTTADCLVGAVAALGEYEVYTLHPQHFPMTEVRLYHKTISAITAATKPRLQNLES
jgi:predicted nucleic acid-binding protein